MLKLCYDSFPSFGLDDVGCEKAVCNPNCVEGFVAKKSHSHKVSLCNLVRNVLKKGIDTLLPKESHIGKMMIKKKNKNNISKQCNILLLKITS